MLRASLASPLKLASRRSHVASIRTEVGYQWAISVDHLIGTRLGRMHPVTLNSPKANKNEITRDRARNVEKTASTRTTADCRDNGSRVLSDRAVGSELIVRTNQVSKVTWARAFSARITSTVGVSHESLGRLVTKIARWMDGCVFGSLRGSHGMHVCVRWHF